MIAVSIYCYLRKYWAEQKQLLPFHDTDNELVWYETFYIIKMSNKVKDIKNSTYYIFNDIKKFFYPNNIKIAEKSYKNIIIYYVWYVTVKDSKYIDIIE